MKNEPPGKLSSPANIYFRTEVKTPDAKKSGSPFTEKTDTTAYYKGSGIKQGKGQAVRRIPQPD